MLVDRALGHANDAAEGAGVAAERISTSSEKTAPTRRRLPLRGVRPAVLLRALEPGLGIPACARVPFDAATMASRNARRCPRPHRGPEFSPTEEPVPREALGARHDPLEK